MIALEIVSWWYRQGWSAIAINAKKRIVGVSHLFSVPILVRTLFAPWRRIITYPGAGLQAKFQAMIDNLVGRFIGFCVRSLVLLAAGFMLTFAALFGFMQLILWPLVPFAVVLLLIKGIVG